MREFSLEQTGWIWPALILAVIVAGITIVVLLPPAGFENHQAIKQPSPTPAQDPLGGTTVFVTPAEMENYITSLRRSAVPRDPFLNTGEEEWKAFLCEVKNRPPRLEGIIQSDGRRVALIQDDRYHEGDVVDGFRIMQIEDTQMILAKGDKTFTVQVTE
ncbi:MAG: hypothetical protein JXD19_08970 [Deltaproteobacteria bacterium]|nr:hypothetical protein [Deltaproteobacteria bacterium]